MNKKTRSINPLLYWIETIFIDWWLLRVFAIIYTPVPRKLRETTRKHFESDLIPFLQNKKRYIEAGNKDYSDKSAFEEALMYAESQAVISSPLAMVGILLMVVFFITPLLNVSNTEHSYMFKVTLLIISALGIRAYLRVRYNVYKMRRIVADAD